MNVERALTADVWIVAFRISLARSWVASLHRNRAISGELSRHRWVQGERDVHAGVSFMLRPGVSPSQWRTRALRSCGSVSDHHDRIRTRGALCQALRGTKLILIHARSEDQPHAASSRSFLERAIEWVISAGCASGSQHVASHVHMTCGHAHVTCACTCGHVHVASIQPLHTCVWAHGLSQFQIASFQRS